MRRLEDRFGIGWRPKLAAAILGNLESIDIVEVLAEEYFGASRADLGALRFLATQVSTTVHATSLGMASVAPVDRKRVERVARVVDTVKPEIWSDHLAFVRSGEIEIGHLAAPPRTRETITGLARNVDSAARIVGSRPALENIATLVDPPFSEMSEAEWVRSAIHVSGASLLLDLHNLYANCTNFHESAFEFLANLGMTGLPIAYVHIAGGRRIRHLGEERVLDDHLHATPDPVFELLRELATIVPASLTVILERDGNYARPEELIAEVDRARAAVAAGRNDAISRHRAVSGTALH